MKFDRECSCEEVGHGDFGPVSSSERLARVLTSPNHIAKDNETFKPSAFPRGHIQRTGISLIRVDRIDVIELRKQADAIAGNRLKEKLLGVGLSNARQLRDAVDLNTGKRLFCVVDDPVMATEQLPENLAHAYLVSAYDVELPVILKLQGILMDFFKPLIPIEKVY